MSAGRFHISSSTVYRPVADKLVVAQVDSGKIFYYNLASKALFERLREPQTLEELTAAFGLEKNSPEACELASLVDVLWNQKLITPADEAAASAPKQTQPSSFDRFSFLYQEEKSLEEVLLTSCPPACS